MLPAKKHHSAEWDPALPQILAAWWDKSDDLKRERFERTFVGRRSTAGSTKFLRSFPKSQ